MSHTHSAEAGFTTVIEPRTRLFDVNLKELWHYRDLLGLFVKRNIAVQYKQTILGPLWYIVQPALTVVMYMVVFGGIAGIPTDGIPQPLFYLAGVCIWQYFADCLNNTANTFVTNSNIFGKVYFPRLIMPLSDTVSNLLRFSIQLGLFLIVYAVYAFIGVPAHLTWYALLFPLLVLMLAGLALGFGILISSMTTKYRDLQILFSFLVQLWMYATPIFYPASILPDEFKFILNVNPLYYYINNMRTCIIGGISPEPLQYIICALFAFGSVGLGSLVFFKAQDRFILYL